MAPSNEAPAGDRAEAQTPERWAHIDHDEMAARHYNLESFYMGYSSDNSRAFRGRSLRLGDPVPPIRLSRLDGAPFDRATDASDSYLALVFGSGSAGPCLDAIGELEALHRSLEGTNAAIVFVYTREAHPNEPVGPGGMRMPAHRSLDQKMAQAIAFRDALGLTIPIVVDDLVGTVDRTFGALPWFNVIVAPDGTLFQRADWVDVDLLGATLRNVGKAQQWDAEGRPAHRRPVLYCETFWLRERTPGLWHDAPPAPRP